MVSDGIIHDYLGCIHGNDVCFHGCHDDIEYRQSDTTLNITEMLEWAANHDGNLDPYHANRWHGMDDLDTRWAAVYTDASLLDRREP